MESTFLTCHCISDQIDILIKIRQYFLVSKFKHHLHGTFRYSTIYIFYRRLDLFFFYTSAYTIFQMEIVKAIQKREQPATTLRITRSHKAKFNPFVPFTRAIKQN